MHSQHKMLRASILTLALAASNPFHLNVRPAFYLPCLLAMPEKASLMICLGDRKIGILMDCGNTGSVKLGNVRKKWLKNVLVHIFLFIVRYFLSFVLNLLSQPYL